MVNFPAAIRLEMALIFFRSLLVQSESANQFFELMVLAAELGDFKRTRTSVVGLGLKPAIYSVPSDAVLDANFRNGGAILNLRKDCFFG